MQLSSRKCTYRSHPNSHLECGAILLKSVTLSSGKLRLYPFKVYFYQSLRNSLHKFLLRPGFAELCEHWRLLKYSSNEMRDVYDGKIWKEFQYVGGKPVLADHSYMLNVDWFQPFKLPV